jgi:hypothetical protein
LEGEKEEREQPGFRIGLVPLIACAVLLIVAVVGTALVLRHKPANSEKSDATKPPPKVAVAPVPKPEKAPVQKPTNAITQVAVQPVTNSPPRPKSLDDLKVGPIELEKTKGSSLVYAVGTLKNDSEYERYGVRVNLDLLNSKGDKIGTATDYAESLTPHQEWQFRALVIAPKTVSARFATLKEDQ